MMGPDNDTEGEDQLITRDEAIELARKTFAEQGMHPESIEAAIEQMPDEVLDAIMQTGEVEVNVQFIDASALREIIDGLRGPDGHLPGCDGKHELHDHSERYLHPQVGIVLSDDPDAPDRIGNHALGNIHVLLKAMLTWLALEPAQLTRLRHWMEDREAEVGASGPGLQASMRLTPSLLAFIGKAIRNPHPDCPMYSGEQCEEMSVVDGKQYKPDVNVAAKIPAAFRKPRFSAGSDGTKDEGEPVLDPRLFGPHPFSI